MATILRPLSLGELLDRTFFLYRKHFILFVGITALPNLLWLAVQLAGVLGHGPVGAIFTRVAWIFVGILVYLIAMLAAHSATVVAVSRLHLDQPISIGAAYNAIKSRLPHLVLIMIGLWLGIGLGFLLLIIPGIILALMWALTIPVAVVEKVGLRAATSRSTDLSKGSRGRIFVVYFLFLVLAYIVNLMWQAPLVAFIAIQSRTNPGSYFTVIQVLSALGTFVSNCLVGPLATIALSLIYYDQRVRKEAFDLEVMMSSLTTNADAAAATGAM